MANTRPRYTHTLLHLLHLHSTTTNLFVSGASRFSELTPTVCDLAQGKYFGVIPCRRFTWGTWEQKKEESERVGLPQLRLFLKPSRCECASLPLALVL
jgi:hypothetical protein